MQTDGPRFEKFCAVYCRHTKGRWAGTPLEFEPWQQEFWDEALRQDRKGQRVYRFILKGVPRKNYKAGLRSVGVRCARFCSSSTSSAPHDFPPQGRRDVAVNAVAARGEAAPMAVVVGTDGFELRGCFAFGPHLHAARTRDARGVSESVLEGIARALQFDEAERAHLIDLVRIANTTRPPRRRPTRQRVRPSI